MSSPPSAAAPAAAAAAPLLPTRVASAESSTSLVDVDAKTGEDAASPKPAGSLEPIASQFSSAASAAAASMSSMFSAMNMNLAKARQLANETIGKAEKTELSEEYRTLETHFDRIRTVIENLIKVGTLFIQPGLVTDVKMSFASTIETAAVQMQTQPSMDKPLIDRLRSVDLPKTSSSQSLGAHFIRNGQMLGEEIPLGLALMKCGDVQDKLGRGKLQMNADIYEKFVKPLEHLQDVNVRNAMAARRAVQNARLSLDTCKLRMKSARADKVDQVRAEIDAAQAQLDTAVAVATKQMKDVTGSNEVLTCLADFTQAMLAYYRGGFSLLEELAPEIDAMKVAQETTPGNA